MPFWMTHPEHGRMPLYDRGDVERVGKFGWTLLNEGPFPEPSPIVAKAADTGTVVVSGDVLTALPDAPPAKRKYTKRKG